MDSTDWWSVICEGAGSVIGMWAGVVVENPWPWLAVLGISLLGLLVPARRSRQRF